MGKKRIKTFFSVRCTLSCLNVRQFESSLKLISPNSFNLPHPSYSPRSSSSECLHCSSLQPCDVTYQDVAFWESVLQMKNNLNFHLMRPCHEMIVTHFVSTPCSEVSIWTTEQDTLGYSIRLWMMQNNLKTQQQWTECLSWTVQVELHGCLQSVHSSWIDQQAVLLLLSLED